MIWNVFGVWLKQKIVPQALTACSWVVQNNNSRYELNGRCEGLVGVRTHEEGKDVGNGSVAQLVECALSMGEVPGSKPGTSTQALVMTVFRFESLRLPHSRPVQTAQGGRNVWTFNSSDESGSCVLVQ